MSILSPRKRADFIVVHCTATIEGQHFDRAAIDRMHRQRGFTMIGYHFLILLNGTIEIGRPVGTVGAHVQNFNSVSVGISYVGGVDAKNRAKDTRTPEQKAAMVELLTDLRQQYPEAIIKGHRDFSKDTNGNGRIDPHERIKECPCFDAIPEYADL